MEGIADCGLWIADSMVESLIRNPQSEIRNCLAVKDRRLLRALGWLEAEVPVRPRRGAAAARRAGEEALLHQKRLVHLFQCAGVLPDGGGDGAEAHRPAVELLD